MIRALSGSKAVKGTVGFTIRNKVVSAIESAGPNAAPPFGPNEAANAASKAPAQHNRATIAASIRRMVVAMRVPPSTSQELIYRRPWPCPRPQA